MFRADAGVHRYFLDGLVQRLVRHLLQLGAGYRPPELDLYGEDMSTRYSTNDARAGQIRELWQSGRHVPARSVADDDVTGARHVTRPHRHDRALAAPPRLEQVLIRIERRRQWARKHRPQVREFGQDVGLEAQRELIGHAPMVDR